MGPGLKKFIWYASSKSLESNCANRAHDAFTEIRVRLPRFTSLDANFRWKLFPPQTFPTKLLQSQLLKQTNLLITDLFTQKLASEPSFHGLPSSQWSFYKFDIWLVGCKKRESMPSCHIDSQIFWFLYQTQTALYLLRNIIFFDKRFSSRRLGRRFVLRPNIVKVHITSSNRWPLFNVTPACFPFRAALFHSFICIRFNTWWRPRTRNEGTLTIHRIHSELLLFINKRYGSSHEKTFLLRHKNDFLIPGEGITFCGSSTLMNILSVCTWTHGGARRSELSSK